MSVRLRSYFVCQSYAGSVELPPGYFRRRTAVKAAQVLERHLPSPAVYRIPILPRVGWRHGRVRFFQRALRTVWASESYRKAVA